MSTMDIRLDLSTLLPPEEEGLEAVTPEWLDQSLLDALNEHPTTSRTIARVVYRASTAHDTPWKLCDDDAEDFPLLCLLDDCAERTSFSIDHGATWTSRDCAALALRIVLDALTPIAFAHVLDVYAHSPRVREAHAIMHMDLAHLCHGAESIDVKSRISRIQDDCDSVRVFLVVPHGDNAAVRLHIAPVAQRDHAHQHIHSKSMLAIVHAMNIARMPFASFSRRPDNANTTHQERDKSLQLRKDPQQEVVAASFFTTALASIDKSMLLSSTVCAMAVHVLSCKSTGELNMIFAERTMGTNLGPNDPVLAARELMKIQRVPALYLEAAARQYCGHNISSLLQNMSDVDASMILQMFVCDFPSCFSADECYTMYSCSDNHQDCSWGPWYPAPLHSVGKR